MPHRQTSVAVEVTSSLVIALSAVAGLPAPEWQQIAIWALPRRPTGRRSAQHVPDFFDSLLPQHPFHVALSGGTANANHFHTAKPAMHSIWVGGFHFIAPTLLISLLEHLLQPTQCLKLLIYYPMQLQFYLFQVLGYNKLSLS